MVPRKLPLSILASLLVLALSFPSLNGSTIDISADIGPVDDPPAENGVVYTEPQEIGRPNRIAVIEVSGWGTIKFELYDNMTPITTQNFVDLASTGFYDGISFHRCIDDFVAQTGDPNTKNNNPYDDGSGGSGQTIPLEICENASHVDGAVGMARSTQPDSASSQFYICDGPQHGLDDWVRMENNGEHGYAVFGVVIEGLDIAKAIAATDTYGMRRPLLKDHPTSDIVMSDVHIEDGVWKNVTNEPDGRESSSKTSNVPFDPLLLLPSVLIVLIMISRKRSL